MPKKALELTGKQFGFWAVLHQMPKEPSRNGSRWLCQCVCGQTKIRKGSDLTRVFAMKDIHSWRPYVELQEEV